jgi:hypothetical protein
MSVTLGPLTAYSQWLTARILLSIVFDGFNEASRSFHAFGTWLSRTHESLLQSIESDLPVLQEERQRFFESVAVMKQLHNYLFQPPESHQRSWLHS